MPGTRGSSGVAAVVLGLALAACGAPTRPAAHAPGGTPPPTAPAPRGSLPVTTAPHDAAPPSRPGGPTLSRALADATSARWAHVVTTSVLPAASGGHGLSVQDSGPGEGRQRYAVGGLTLSIVVLGPATYVLGSTRALEALASEPSGIAVRVGGRWVELAHGDAAYARVTAGVTLGSVLQTIPVGRHPQMRPAVLGGRQVLRIVSHLGAAQGGATQTVWVSTGPRPLPLRVTQQAATGSSVIRFGAWGRPATVSAPSGAVRLPTAPPGVTLLDQPAPALSSPQSRARRPDARVIGDATAAATTSGAPITVTRWTARVTAV